MMYEKMTIEQTTAGTVSFAFAEVLRGGGAIAVGVTKEVGFTEIDVGYPEHEIRVILVAEGHEE